MSVSCMFYGSLKKFKFSKFSFQFQGRFSLFHVSSRQAFQCFIKFCSFLKLQISSVKDFRILKSVQSSKSVQSKISVLGKIFYVSCKFQGNVCCLCSRMKNVISCKLC